MGEGKGEKRRGRPDTEPFLCLYRTSKFRTLALIGRDMKGYVTPPETKIIKSASIILLGTIFFLGGGNHLEFRKAVIAKKRF